MRAKSYLLSCAVCAAVFTGCTRGDVTIADFESGTWAGWIVEGDAFGAAPSKGAAGVQHEVAGFEGRFLANSFSGGGDDLTGTLTSEPFTVSRSHLNFLLGGGVGCRVELLVDGEPVLTASPTTDGEVLIRRTWDVTPFKGARAQIRIVDDRAGGWGHILADGFTLSDKPRTDILTGHREPLRVESDYILIPVEDSAPAVRVCIEADGRKIEPGMDIRLAVDNPDYYVPIDVSGYKGREITLVFDHIRADGCTLRAIRQADGHDFNYSKKYRPNYHFSPCSGWMNDPNGMVYHRGEYHLFFQHNPYGSTWGNMHWGHAVSKDLRRWEYLPEAIEPDTLGTIFSGSAVIDRDDTAGFGPDAMIAIYTSEGRTQTQCIAYSTDNGRSFTKYEGNPVLTSDTYRDFRDPKVFWHTESGKWIMALATGQVISFYSSPDLKQWRFESDFGEGVGAHGGVWECPDLFPLVYNGQRKWVLLVSINPGGPNGGSATQYFVGRFDGTAFTADPLPYPLWLDHGRDNYAGVTWSNTPDDRRIFIGWMNNWDYANQVPTLNFRSAMTTPRELSLAHNGVHLAVASNPVPEFDLTRSRTAVIPDAAVTGEQRWELMQNGSGYEIELEAVPAGCGSFTLALANPPGEQVVWEFDLTAGTVTTDRSRSGQVTFSDAFAPQPIEAPLYKKGSYRLRLLVDNCSTELFINGGHTVLTNTVFPSEPYTEMHVSAAGGALNLKNILIHTLK